MKNLISALSAALLLAFSGTAGAITDEEILAMGPPANAKCFVYGKRSNGWVKFAAISDGKVAARYAYNPRKVYSSPLDHAAPKGRLKACGAKTRRGLGEMRPTN